MTLKFSRLFQPRNPAFWYLVVLNGLSAAISYVLRERELSTVVSFVLAFFALGNAWFGLLIAWRLMRDEPPRPPE